MTPAGRGAPSGVRQRQALAGAAVAAVGALMAWGASGIPSDAGYAGVGPNFLPWVVSLALMGCGVLLVAQALGGGWKAMPGEDASADSANPETADSHARPSADWTALAWMVAGVLVNAALITRVGFVLSCALCFMLAVRGLRLSEGAATRGAAAWLQAARDLLIGAAIAAPVYWIFTKLLNISLPGLTAGGWL